MTKGVLLHLMLTNQEGLVEDMNICGSLGCSDHQTVGLRILNGRSNGVSRTRSLDFQTANLGLLKDLLREIPWDRALDEKGVQESWTTGRASAAKGKLWKM